jgi:hypothetical protein
MTKILDNVSRVMALLGVALIVWAGIGGQKAEAIQIGCTAQIDVVCRGWLCESDTNCCIARRFYIDFTQPGPGVTVYYCCSPFCDGKGNVLPIAP